MNNCWILDKLSHGDTKWTLTSERHSDGSSYTVYQEVDGHDTVTFGVDRRNFLDTMRCRIVGISGKTEM